MRLDLGLRVPCQPPLGVDDLSLSVGSVSEVSREWRAVDDGVGPLIHRAHGASGRVPQ